MNENTKQPHATPDGVLLAEAERNLANCRWVEDEPLPQPWFVIAARDQRDAVPVRVDVMVIVNSVRG